jgi:hypothetical protein
MVDAATAGATSTGIIGSPDSTSVLFLYQIQKQENQ